MDAKDQLGGSVGDQNGDMDRFPDGMRVLAVDDDLTYLKFLEATLRKCNYEVTTANHAYEALQILRENRNKFDLVISDVQMPDMDGFQLLKLLGHEMDLPVIMVSGNGDTELMKKGISHGACCYLVKPVNIEVFKTIWQHVFRRKKLNSKDQCKSCDQDKVCKGTGEGEEGMSAASSSDKNGKHKRKRKHQNEDDEEGEDDEDENEEPSTQKKRRIVWSEELHKKFLDVFYYLGPEKAVPKKILELMNVEDLSRGNVASHLQKFREQLKKGGSKKEKQRASMVVDLGRKDSSYMLHTGPVDESGGRLSNPAPLSSYIPPQMLSRSNSPTDFNMPRINPSSHLLRLGQSQNLCNSINNVANLQPSVLTNQSRNLFQVSQAPVEQNQLQQKNSTIDIRQSTPNNNGSTSTFPYKGLPGSSVGYDCNTSMLQGNPQQKHGTLEFGNQSSLRVNSLNPKSFDNALCRSSNFLDFLDNDGYGESWQGGMQGCGQLYQFPSTALLRSEASNFGQFPANNLGVSSSTPQIGNTPNDFSSVSALSTSVEEPRENIHIKNQGHVVPTMYCTPNQWWEDHKQDYNHNWNLSSIVSSNGVVDPLSRTLDQNDAVCSRSINSSLFDQFNGGNRTIVQRLEVENSTMHTKIDPNEDYILLEQAKSNDGLVQNSLGSLDNQVELENEFDLLDGEFGFDAIQEQKKNDEYDLLDGGFRFEA
ncbi:two-component response regulator ARR12-like [Rosa rugosa]|uniref:two-component response regulator ARR12-like n=1 Tax=Rosa rugosa TaxID=74645 RepID=UPI002B4144A0|nr:two-component response regulator ARR12-like [Rosa rugosa]